jgi:hypothetical protein
MCGFLSINGTDHRQHLDGNIYIALPFILYAMGPYRFHVKSSPTFLYTLSSEVSHPCGNQSARDITEFCCVNMDA